jgi:hypothetical protein
MKRFSALLFVLMMSSAVAQTATTDPTIPIRATPDAKPAIQQDIPGGTGKHSKLPPSPLPASMFANPIEQQILDLQKRIVALEEALKKLQSK